MHLGRCWVVCGCDQTAESGWRGPQVEAGALETLSLFVYLCVFLSLCPSLSASPSSLLPSVNEKLAEGPV